jgi:hypothetical protein
MIILPNPRIHTTVLPDLIPWAAPCLSHCVPVIGLFGAGTHLLIRSSAALACPACSEQRFQTNECNFEPIVSLRCRMHAYRWLHVGT